MSDNALRTMSDIRALASEVSELGNFLTQLREDATKAPLSKQELYASEIGLHDVQLGYLSSEAAVGFPLPVDIRFAMERMFGADFRDVRIHTGAMAHKLVRQKGARAITIGMNLYFANGMYAPDTEDGLRLLIHELTHVQQHLSHVPMVYAEDIEALEWAALRVERESGNIRTYEFAQGQFATDGTTFNNDEKANVSQHLSGAANPPAGDMQDFVARQKEKMIRVELSNGSLVELTPQKYRSCIEQIACEVREWLEEESMSKTTTERERLLMRYYEWVGV